LSRLFRPVRRYENHHHDCDRDRPVGDHDANVHRDRLRRELRLHVAHDPAAIQAPQ
jgi:hypothetical protein